jgi:O-antigen/teichoic acid export membrane protein
MIIGFSAGIILARCYGPEGYGTLSYLIALTAVFGCLASFGLDDLLPRDLASGMEQIARTDILKTAAIIRLLAGLGTLALLGLTLELTPIDASTRQLGWLLGGYYLFQSLEVIECDLRVQGRYFPIAISRITASLTAGGVKVVVALMGLPLWTVVLAMLLEYAVTAGCFIRFTERTRLIRMGCFSTKYAKTLIRRALPLILAGGLYLLQSRLDILLVEASLGATALGHYTAALRITELLDTIAIVLSLVLIPEFGRLHGKALDQRIEQAYLSGILLLIATLPALALMCLFFGHIYGSAYIEGATLIPWLAIRPFFYMISVIRSAALIAQNQGRWIPVYPVVTIAFIGVAFDPFVEEFGLRGAAMAGSLSIVVGSLLVDALINRSNLKRILRSPLSFPGLWRAITQATKAR